jgi:DnaK suppressor protein
MSKQKITKTKKQAPPAGVKKAVPKAKPSPEVKAAPKAKTVPEVKAAPKPKTAPEVKAMPKLKVAPARTVARPAPPPPADAKGRKTAYSKQELENFRKIILDKKKEILEELETLRDSMMDATTGEYASESSMYSTHMEQGTDAMEREKTFLFASREGKFLNYLEDALQRIEKGEYGKCSECGKLIEKERLEAVPHARQCLHCKMNLSK